MAPIHAVTLLVMSAFPVGPALFLSARDGGVVPRDLESANLALIACATRAEAECVAEQLRQGADPNASLFGNPVLYIAAGADEPAVLSMLFRAGANLNARTAIAGRTALHEAVLKGRIQNVALLMSLGADTSITTHHGRTPLDFALHPPAPLQAPPNHEEIAKVLRGEKVEAVEKSSSIDSGALISGWSKRARASLRELAADSFAAVMSKLGLPPQDDADYVACMEDTVVRAFPDGWPERTPEVSERMAAISDSCAHDWRAPIEASTSWTKTAANLYLSQCERSGWAPRLLEGVSETEFCSCLVASARKVFRSPARLWELERSSPGKLTKEQKTAVSALVAPCARLLRD